MLPAVVTRVRLASMARGPHLLPAAGRLRGMASGTLPRGGAPGPCGSRRRRLCTARGRMVGRNARPSSHMGWAGAAVERQGGNCRAGDVGRGGAGAQRSCLAERCAHPRVTALHLNLSVVAPCASSNHRSTTSGHLLAGSSPPVPPPDPDPDPAPVPGAGLCLGRTSHTRITPSSPADAICMACAPLGPAPSSSSPPTAAPAAEALPGLHLTQFTSPACASSTTARGTNPIELLPAPPPASLSAASLSVSLLGTDPALPSPSPSGEGTI